MDNFLADYYGTGAPAETTNDEIEKMAQLTLLAQDAQEQGIDLSEFSDEELVKAASELYPGAAYQDDIEKEAAAKFEEADFLGRVMAHSFNQELGEIEKEAASLKGVYDATLGRVGRAAQRAVGKRYLPRDGVIGGTGTEHRLLRRLGGGRRPKFWKKMTDTERSAFLQSAEHSGMPIAKGVGRLGRGASVAAQAATVAGGAAGLGAAGYGAHRGAKAIYGGKDKKSADSAFEQLALERAYEHLDGAGYDADQFFGVDKTAADLDAAVDRAALEFLEANGVPVEWNNG